MPSMLISTIGPGAYMAQSLRVDPSVVALIKHHHDQTSEPATIELALLQSADAKN